MGQDCTAHSTQTCYRNIVSHGRESGRPNDGRDQRGLRVSIRFALLRGGPPLALTSILDVVIHRELVGMRAKTKGIVFFLFHLQPVRDEVGVEDIAFEKERVIAFERGDRATK